MRLWKTIGRIKIDKERGFTLVELLVVIAIIGVLASILLLQFGSARARTRDAKKISDFSQIRTALYAYYESNGSMPLNYNPGLGACSTDAGTAYDQSMTELLTTGFLPKIPEAPAGAGTGFDYYCYYNYGPGTEAGAIIVTVLESYPNSTTGRPGSCRPWGAGVPNWCNQTANKYHCVCNPY